MQYVYKFQLGYDPVYQGTLDEFRQEFKNIEIGNETLGGITQLFVYLDSMFSDDFRVYYLADRHEDMFRYAEQKNDELYGVIEEDIEDEED